MNKSNEGELQMKHTVSLTITSLLSILFTAFHLADDIVRGIEPGGVNTLAQRSQAR